MSNTDETLGPVHGLPIEFQGDIAWNDLLRYMSALAASGQLIQVNVSDPRQETRSYLELVTKLGHGEELPLSSSSSPGWAYALRDFKGYLYFYPDAMRSASLATRDVDDYFILRVECDDTLITLRETV